MTSATDSIKDIAFRRTTKLSKAEAFKTLENINYLGGYNRSERMADLYNYLSPPKVRGKMFQDQWAVRATAGLKEDRLHLRALRVKGGMLYASNGNMGVRKTTTLTDGWYDKNLHPLYDTADLANFNVAMDKIIDNAEKESQLNKETLYFEDVEVVRVKHSGKPTDLVRVSKDTWINRKFIQLLSGKEYFTILNTDAGKGRPLLVELMPGSIGLIMPIPLEVT